MQPFLPFWAKTKDRVSLNYHPVAFHGLDVAASGCRLLQLNDGLRRRLARTSGLDEEPLLGWAEDRLDLAPFSARGDDPIASTSTERVNRRSPRVRG